MPHFSSILATNFCSTILFVVGGLHMHQAMFDIFLLAYFHSSNEVDILPFFSLHKLSRSFSLMYPMIHGRFLCLMINFVKLYNEAYYTRKIRSSSVGLHKYLSMIETHTMSSESSGFLLQ